MSFSARLPWLALLPLLPALLAGQSLDSPRTGIIFDPASQNFRPVIGVLGAASLGAPLLGGAGAQTAGVCSGQNFALASGGDGAVALIRFDQTPPPSLPAGTAATPDRIELSASCDAALLYFASSGRIQILTGLPGAPVLAADFTLSLPARPSSLAINDGGTLILAAVPGNGIYLVSPGAAPTLLLPLVKGGAVAFRGAQDAIAADTQNNTVLLLTGLAGAPSIQTLAGPDQGISAPNAVWFDAAQQQVLIGNSGAGGIAAVRLSGEPPKMVSCGCQIAGFTPMGPEVFEVAAPSATQPLLVLDASAASPRIVFVAAQPGAIESQ